jgi:simple sugar transport system permease protein
MAAGSLLILLAGRSPAHVWWAMASRTLTDPYTIGQVLYRATGVALTGLSVALSLEAGLFNIGAEGQLVAGMLACSVVGAALPVSTPALLAIPIAILSAAAAGAAMGAIVGALRVYRGAHEVITSIMLNTIVAGVALWLGNAVLFLPGTTWSRPIVKGAEIPSLGVAGSPLNGALALALSVTALVGWLRARTVWGHTWRAVGASPTTAEAGGIDVRRVRFTVLTASGSLAGLAACNFVLGHQHSFEEGLGRGTGYLGIAVAMLGRRPWGVLGASLLVSFLSSGGLAVADLVPKELSEVLQGLVILAVAVSRQLVSAPASLSVRGDE